MNTLPRFAFLVTRIGIAATALIAGYEWFLCTVGGAARAMELSPGVVVAGLGWSALAAALAGAMLRSHSERIGIGAVLVLLAIRGVVELATGQCLNGVAPALLGVAAGLTAVLAHDGLPVLAMARAKVHHLTAPPSSIDGPLSRAA